MSSISLGFLAQKGSRCLIERTQVVLAYRQRYWKDGVLLGYRTPATSLSA